MTEWGVVGVLVVLAGLFFTVGKPIFCLITAIEKLTHICSELSNKFEKFEAENKDSHRRLWAHSSMQDERLNDHDKRIHVLEMGGEKNED